MGLLLPAVLSLALLVLLFVCSYTSSGLGVLLASGYFIGDNISVILSMISLVFLLGFSRTGLSSLGVTEGFLLLVSLISSIVCFFSNHVIVFWVSYELSILPLLASILVNSPYSERYLGGWYLFSYLSLSSLPLLLLFLYISVYSESWFISEVCVSPAASATLFVLFISKMPLPPFHTWLPVVHAEASSFVSIMLSGYVMKLGVLGLFRFCCEVLTGISGVVASMFFFSILFFLVASGELDVKRWLAFLSLSHILIATICFLSCGSEDSFSGLLFSLAHGISAGLLFYCFMVAYNIVGSRNWLVVVNSTRGSQNWNLMVVLSILTVVAFPPSLSFMCEVYAVSLVTSSGILLSALGLYVFLGGLVPMLVLANAICSNSLVGFNRPTPSQTLVLTCPFILWICVSLVL